MTSPQDLIELAERCEMAKRHDRTLDCDIWQVVREPHQDQPGDVSKWQGPPYTASLDAALTLVDRYGVLLHLSDIGADGLPMCNIGDSVTAREFKGIGTANLALAVCAAALRARASILNAERKIS